MISRQDFLAITTKALLWLSGLLGLGGVLRFLSYQPPPPPPRRFELGPETNYPVGSRTVIPDVPALLIRDPDGIRAISLICTHLGCTLEYQADNFSCPCHGSRFDREGQVVKGPAVEPLQTLAVERNADGGLVIVKT